MINCSPMKAKITADACLKMSITRPECVGCPRVNPATPKEQFHHFFNSSIPRKKPGRTIIVAKSKKVTVVKEKPTKKKQKIRKKEIKCFNCKVTIRGHRKSCKPCENAKGDVLLLSEIRSKRKSGKIHRGRIPGFKKKKTENLF